MTDKTPDALPKEIYSGEFTKGAIGYCSSGHWAGWIFWKHPDGQWVSLAKIPDRAAPHAEAVRVLVEALLDISSHTNSYDYPSKRSEDALLHPAVVAAMSKAEGVK